MLSLFLFVCVFCVMSYGIYGGKNESFEDCGYVDYFGELDKVEVKEFKLESVGFEVKKVKELDKDWDYEKFVSEKLEELEGLKIKELWGVSKELGLKYYKKYKKVELVDKLVELMVWNEIIDWEYVKMLEVKEG